MLTVLVLLWTYAVFGKDDFKGDQVLRVIPTNDDQISFLRKWIGSSKHLDIWREPNIHHNDIDVHVDSSEIERVKRMLSDKEIDYEIMIHDLDYAFDEVDAANEQFFFHNGFDYSKYHRYSEIKMELENLARLHGNKANKFIVGKTFEGEDRVGLKITDGHSGRAKPAIWIDGGIHAREWIAISTVMFFLHTLLTSDSKDVQNVLQKYDFYILPVFNIDGYKHTWTSRRARIWRKTRSYHGVGCHGVDPNRNWGYKWGGVGTSEDPCSEIYCGHHPFSEIEVKHVAEYLRNISNLKAYWNIHSYGQLVLTPWSYKTELPTDYEEIQRVANNFVEEVGVRYGTEYKAGPPSRVLYAVAGGSIDWVYAVLGVKYSYALELRDQGKYGFVLPPKRIIPSGLETTDALLASIQAME